MPYQPTYEVKQSDRGCWLIHIDGSVYLTEAGQIAEFEFRSEQQALSKVAELKARYRHT